MDASSDSAYRALAAKIDSLGQLCARLARENGRGVVGVNSAQTPRQLSGAGVLGRGEGGVVGVRGMSDTGRGGVFSGAAAQVRLMPGTKSTHPTSGNRGDLYADSLGRLWFCKVPGARAHWHQIA